MSGGEQQMLAIARGLMANPKVQILDEPSLGLAPLIVNEVIAYIDEITVINFGSQLATGNPEEIQNNQEVIDAYLGVGD